MAKTLTASRLVAGADMDDARDLNADLQSVPTTVIPQEIITVSPTRLLDIPLDSIDASDYNPRDVFEEEALRELADSVTVHGVIEPIIVRLVTRSDGRQRYEIVAGERRFRASKLAGMKTIPALVRDIDDDKARVLAVIENLQRRDLDPFEEANGFKILMGLGWNQARIVKEVGCSQGKVSKTLNLLRLPTDVQWLIREGKLTPSHGERLVRFADFPAVCSAIAAKAADRKAPAADLDGKSVPYYYDLQESKLLVQILPRMTDFYDTDCKKCPFNALRPGQYDTVAYCLKPDHYEELVRKEQRKQEALNERVRAAIVQEVTAQKTGAAPTNSAPGAPVPEQQPQGLPMIGEMKYGTYECLDRRSSVPDACGGDCPCRGAALEKRGNQPAEVVAVCLNPARFKKLQDQQKRANNKASRVAYAERFTAARTAAAEAAREFGDAPTGVAAQRVLVVAVWESLRVSGAKAVLPAAARLGIEIDFDAAWHKTANGRPILWDQLEGLASEDLLRLAVESVMEREVLAKFMYGEPLPTDSLGAIDWITSADAESEAPDA